MFQGFQESPADAAACDALEELNREIAGWAAALVEDLDEAAGGLRELPIHVAVRENGLAEDPLDGILEDAEGFLEAPLLDTLDRLDAVVRSLRALLFAAAGDAQALEARALGLFRSLDDFAARAGALRD